MGEMHWEHWCPVYPSLRFWDLIRATFFRYLIRATFLSAVDFLCSISQVGYVTGLRDGNIDILDGFK